MTRGRPTFKRTTTPANWQSYTLVKLFIDICIDEKENTGSWYNLWDWDRISRVLLEEEGVDYNEKQLKRQYATLKTKYEAWCNFIPGAPYHGSIARRNRIKNIRKISEHAEDLKLLFGFSKRPSRANNGVMQESSQSSMDLSQKNTDGTGAHSYNTKSSPSTSSKASLSEDNRDQKSSYSSDFNGDLERVLKTKISSNEEATLERCNQVLNAMEKLKMDCTLYIAACSIFCESWVYREQWMILSKKPEEVRVTWIAMVGKRLGFV